MAEYAGIFFSPQCGYLLFLERGLLKTCCGFLCFMYFFPQKDLEMRATSACGHILVIFVHFYYMYVFGIGNEGKQQQRRKSPQAPSPPLLFFL